MLHCSEIKLLMSAIFSIFKVHSYNTIATAIIWSQQVNCMELNVIVHSDCNNETKSNTAY